MSNVKIWNWVLLFGKASWNPFGCLKVNSWNRRLLKEQSSTICDLYFCQLTLNKLYSVMFAWSDFFELNRVPACCKDDLNLLELRICMVFCRASLWKLHMDLSKQSLKLKLIALLLANPKSTILSVKQRKTSNNLSDRITSAHAIISCCHGKYQNPNDFRALPKTHLKPHFAHFRAFLNIFEQNEWQIRFPQLILRWFPKSDFGHWSTPLRLLFTLERIKISKLRFSQNINIH